MSGYDKATNRNMIGEINISIEILSRRIKGNLENNQ